MFKTQSKTLTQRVALFASSALMAAGVTATGAIIAPQAAHAANECAPVGADPSANGSAADTFACVGNYNGTGGTPNGITYSSNGHLTVNSTGTSNVGTVGVNLSGNNADNVTYTATGTISGTAGPIIDVTSSAGDIFVNHVAISGTGNNVTHGIRAQSTGGGDIVISRASGVVNIGIATTAVAQVAAIEAITDGGNIAISTGTGTTTARSRGIVARTSGAGTIDITANGISLSTATGGGIVTEAGIDTVAGTGRTSIVLTGLQNPGLNGGVGIRSVSAGTVDVDLGGQLRGRVDFSGVSGNVIFDTLNGGFWDVGVGTSNFGSGADTVTLSGVGISVLNAGANINFGAGADTFNVAGTFNANVGTLDFGAGDDAFNLSGVMNYNGVTLANLETFNNRGVIYLGGASGIATNSLPTERFVMSSGVFNGERGRFILDVDMTVAGVQIDCATLLAADCLDFTGATTSGTTLLSINAMGAPTFGKTIALVEGASAAAHFQIDPANRGTPLVRYELSYDAAEKTHFLITAPSDKAYEFSTFAASAQEIWRASSGSWLDRQADLRDAPGDLQRVGGRWAKAGFQSGDREAAGAYSVGAHGAAYNLSHSQNISHFLFGIDFIGASSEDSAFVFGGMVGLAEGETSFDATHAKTETRGGIGGLYASYVAGPFFVDGVLSANQLRLTADAPGLDLRPDVGMKFDVTSLGAQIEAGWRIDVTPNVFVEPIAGASYVTTAVDGKAIPGGSGAFDFDDITSVRIGAGGRLGVESKIFGIGLSSNLTARYWNDSDGETGTRITTASGSSAFMPDEFGGGFSDVSGGVSLHSDGGGVSGFVTVGGKFGDDFQAVNASAGVRLRW